MMYGKPLAPATTVRREAPEPVAPAVPAQMDLGNATIVINNYGPLIIYAGTAEDMAAVVASIVPLPPENPELHSPTNTAPSDTVSVGQNPRPLGDVAAVSTQLPKPPGASQDR